MFWFLLLILLNNFRNLYIVCINFDIDKMLMLDQSKGLRAYYLRVISLCNFYQGVTVLVSASYLAKTFRNI